MLISARAKINLFLDVTSKRDDGYHNIIGVMQSVDISDDVEICKTDDTTVRIICDLPEVPQDERNLAYRAAQKFFEYGKSHSGVVVKIKKRIPMAAGLAGGSADAAAVLLGLNRLDSGRYDIPTLMRIGAGIGADVPFCIAGGAMRTEGIGDVLTPVKPLSTGYIVIAKGGEGVSTPWAYRALDEATPEYNPDYERLFRLQKALADNDLDGVCENMFNAFERVVLPAHSMAVKIKESLLSCGASGAMMSGSGPSVFGLFREKESAAEAKKHIEGMGVQTFLCKLQ